MRNFTARNRQLEKALAVGFDSREFLASVGTGKTVSLTRKNQVIFNQGKAADCVYYLQKGRIKLTVTSEQGKEAIVGMIEPEQFFGEDCLAGQQVRICTARAMEGCEVTSITKEALRGMLHDEPTFSELFIAYLLNRNSQIEQDLIDQLFNSSERRLARLLLLLANFGKDGDTQPIDSKVSQETLAEMIGTTRSRVSHFMNKFRRLRFISYDGTIEVHRSRMNAVLCNMAEINKQDKLDGV
jgi:CRP/FNR family transcriptional regulator, cyclic AMP receptor protein